jgi:hypothetical protein
MLSEKLLADEENLSPDDVCDTNAEQERLQKKCLETTRTSTAVIGFSIGIFIQGSSLALNFILGSIDSKARDISFEKYMGVAVCWSIFSSVLGVGVLLMIRSCMIETFYATNNDIAYDMLAEKERFMVRVMDCMQKSYTLGAMAGLGTAWTTADFLLGCSSRIYQGLLTSIVAIIWFFVTPI